MMKPDICIYHGGCDDGFGAAWAVWKKWPDVQFVPGVYGKEPPDVTGKNVLMVDFSYKRPVIEAMAKAAWSLTILDHHKTAQADLLDMEAWAAMEDCNVKVVFDMDQSGAALAWDYCHGPIDNKLKRPWMIDMIEDRDLWRFKHGDETRQFSAALRTYPMDFDVWQEISCRPEKLVEEGKVILRAHQANIQKFMADVFWEKIGGHSVPCCNVPYHYASDTAHELLQRFPDAPFAASWFKRGDGLFQASLRSEDRRLDVSEIAKKYGGGGHRNAAGFQIPSMDT
jgi:oligoribonuclease NrnB/cAMP/cGMP phosphodiesterase (DHH superfamily)